MKQICIKFSRLFVLIKTYEISVSICKYLQISVYFLDIRFFGYSYFFEGKQIKKIDIRDIQNKSQIPLKPRISNLCGVLLHKYCATIGYKGPEYYPAVELFKPHQNDRPKNISNLIFFCFNLVVVVE